ncbi:unnamed protein product [Coccothraustes coccothraustes]
MLEPGRARSDAGAEEAAETTAPSDRAPPSPFKRVLGKKERSFGWDVAVTGEARPALNVTLKVSPRLAKRAGLTFLRLGTCQARLWWNTTGSSSQMPVAPAETGALVTGDLFTPCMSQVGFGTEGKGGEKPSPVKNVTLAVAGTPLKCRQQGIGGAVLLE